MELGQSHEWLVKTYRLEAALWMGTRSFSLAVVNKEFAGFFDLAGRIDVWKNKEHLLDWALGGLAVLSVPSGVDDFMSNYASRNRWFHTQREVHSAHAGRLMLSS